jgi:hypothetical protein
VIFKSRYLITVLILALVGALILPFDSSAASSGRFVDRDGDGFDDNAADDDIDGIPDELEPHGFFTAEIGQLQVGTMFSSQPLAAAKTPIEAKSETFGRREFHTRGICLLRSDFDAGFGTGLGLSGGLGGGGACAGGVCF